MSIIHEALKKVQSGRSDTRPILTPRSQPPPAGAPTTKTRRRFFIMGLGVFLSALLIYQLGSMAGRTQPNSSAQFPQLLPSSSMAMSGQQRSASPSLPLGLSHSSSDQPPRNEEILLTGIVLMDGKNYALINGEFYQEGETIGATVITRITVDSIDVLQNGKSRTIKVIRPD